MRWSVALACLALVTTDGQSAFADGDATSCGRSGQPFVQVYFVGNAWPAPRKHAVLRELGVELRRRRALDVCASPDEGFGPRGVVTLLANDPDRVSVVPFRLLDEGSFNGRTIELRPIPEDARALAIAQAVDEVLLGEAPAAPKPTVSAPSPAVTAPIAVAPPPLRLALALGASLQIAPGAATGADKSSFSPGLAARIVASARRWGTSVGMTLPTSSNLVFGSVNIEQRRTPFDFSFDLVAVRQSGGVEALLSGGLVVALLRSELTADGTTQQRGEVGARLGFTVSYGNQIVPWIGTSIELIPVRSEIRLPPVGSVGTTSSVWLSLAAGVALRWPS